MKLNDLFLTATKAVFFASLNGIFLLLAFGMTQSQETCRITLSRCMLGVLINETCNNRY